MINAMEQTKSQDNPPAVGAPVAIPRTALDVIDFIGDNFDSKRNAVAAEDTRYSLTVRDLLSAFRDLSDESPASSAEGVTGPEKLSRRWYGSPPWKGWTIVQGRKEVVYLGEVDERIVDAIIDAFNNEKAAHKEPLLGERQSDHSTDLRQQSGETAPIVGGSGYGCTPLAPAAASAEGVTDLHPRTDDLVDRFASALKTKLAAAEKKYGYSDKWSDSDWQQECAAKLLEHVAKGDPRDVAAYCAFMWHHGWSTAAPAASLREQEEVIHAGRVLSNCAFNLAQRTPGMALTSDDISALNDSRKAWDAAIDAQRLGREKGDKP